MCWRLFLSLMAVWISSMAAPPLATAETLTVDGTANIYTAGLGRAWNGVLPSSVSFTPAPGRVLRFGSVTGTVTCRPGVSAPPDGSSACAAGTAISEWGYFSGIKHGTRAMFLVGIFLTDSAPKGWPPPTLDFTRDDFASTAPLVGQTFYIGDGLTGSGSGAPQQFLVPYGATRLFLGFAKAPNFQGGAGDYNTGGGSFSVTLDIGAGTSAGTSPLQVDGRANLMLAGHSAPTDVIPPPFIRFSASSNRVLTFPNVTGTIRWGGGTADPDGTKGYGQDVNSTQGISGIVTKWTVGYLAGVFLDDSEPRDPAPDRLTFNDPFAFEVLEPRIGQTFFIGDGRVTPGGALQRFVAPPTATRLYLGLIFQQLYSKDSAVNWEVIGAFTATIDLGGSTPACTYSITPASVSVVAPASTGAVSVSSATGCAWTAVSNASWLSIGSGATGSGNGVVGYSVAANTSGSARTGTLTIAGQTFTVAQPATALNCTPLLDTTSVTASPAGASGAATVTVASGCSWTAQSNVSWIVIGAGTPGTGNGTVGYTVAPNTGPAARNGTLYIAGLVLTVAQPGLPSAGLVVDAKANIFSAGHAATFGGGVLPPYFRIGDAAGQAVTFTSITGSWTCMNGGAANVPDGAACAGGVTNIASYQGIAGVIHSSRTMFLAGVFLDDTEPKDPAPTRLDFTSAYQLATLSPGLRQIFFIGDGLAGSGIGSPQRFIIPAGATRLYLGIADANSFQGTPGWYDDNSGSVTVVAGSGLTSTASCAYALDASSAAVPAGASTGTLQVAALSGCAWTAASGASWITIASGGSAAGNGTVQYSVAANTTTASRSGILTIAGKTFTVTQPGTTPACTYRLGNPALIAPQAGGSFKNLVAAPAGCTWKVTSNVTWISVTAGAEGSGDGEFVYQVAENTNPDQRLGTITAAGLNLTVTQIGASACTFVLGTNGDSAAAAGKSGNVNVTGSSGCAWKATSNAAWIAITNITTGIGNGMVSYTVAPNTSSGQRIGTLTIAGLTFTITQAGTPCVSLSSSGASHAAAGGSGTVSVTAAAGCTWSVASDSGWLRVITGSSGTGSGTVSYTVDANSGAAARTGTIAIGGQTFTVRQAAAVTPGCTYVIAPAGVSVPADGGEGTVAVTAAGGCAWTASTAASWIEIKEGVSGSGNGSVRYAVAANTAPDWRNAAISIAGKSFGVLQAGASAAPAAGPEISGDGLVNSADFTPAFAPGSMLSILGRRLAAAARSADAPPMPSVLEGTSVEVTISSRNIALPVFSISPARVDAQLPYDLPPGELQLRVRTAAGVSEPRTIRVDPYKPRLFTSPDGGSGEAVAKHADGTPVGSDSPAVPGETLSVFLTGLGPVNPAAEAGQTGGDGGLSPANLVIADVAVTVSGHVAKVAFAGLAACCAGQYQVRFEVPPEVGPGSNSINVQIGGESSQPYVVLAVAGGQGSGVTVPIGLAGGTVRFGQVELTVPAGAFAEEVSIALAPESASGGSGLLSDVYLLSGIPDETAGALTLTFDLPSPPANPEETFLKVESVTDSGLRLLPVTVQGNRVTVTLPAIPAANASPARGGPSMASADGSRRRHAAAAKKRRSHKIALRRTVPPLSILGSMLMTDDGVPAADVTAVSAAVNRANQTLAQIGYELQQPDLPRIRLMAQCQPMAEPFGELVASPLENADQITICTGYGTTEPVLSHAELIQVKTAHLVFHAAVGRRAARSGPSFERQWGTMHNFVWLDEALATWFEMLLAPEGRFYIPRQTVENVDFFVTHPLDFPGSSSPPSGTASRMLAQYHGYGAALFISFLADVGIHDRAEPSYRWIKDVLDLRNLSQYDSLQTPPVVWPVNSPLDVLRQTWKDLDSQWVAFVTNLLWGGLSEHLPVSPETPDANAPFLFKDTLLKLAGVQRCTMTSPSQTCIESWLLEDLTVRLYRVDFDPGAPWPEATPLRTELIGPEDGAKIIAYKLPAGIDASSPTRLQRIGTLNDVARAATEGTSVLIAVVNTLPSIHAPANRTFHKLMVWLEHSNVLTELTQAAEQGNLEVRLQVSNAAHSQAAFVHSFDFTKALSSETNPFAYSLFPATVSGGSFFIGGKGPWTDAQYDIAETSIRFNFASGTPVMSDAVFFQKGSYLSEQRDKVVELKLLQPLEFKVTYPAPFIGKYEDGSSTGPDDPQVVTRYEAVVKGTAIKDYLSGGMNEITKGKITDTVTLEFLPESVLTVTLDIRCCGSGENLRVLQTRTTGYGWDDNTPAGDAISFSKAQVLDNGPRANLSSDGGLHYIGTQPYATSLATGNDVDKNIEKWKNYPDRGDKVFIPGRGWFVAEDYCGGCTPTNPKFPNNWYAVDMWSAFSNLKEQIGVGVEWPGVMMLVFRPGDKIPEALKRKLAHPSLWKTDIWTTPERRLQAKPPGTSKSNYIDGVKMQ